ncbi:hypothetical protein E3N88_06797 [Mikania micrantha]|uniref:NB-ARC domain-containing protein n=1 Tax=Mikania micrantha TaxID=192012 RepID=A0A5N6PQG2_9ASTR|nr:hypothetical protein E3N88_06797 [Mikania micrantha]
MCVLVANLAVEFRDERKNAYEVALQTEVVQLLKAIASVTKRTPKFRTLLKRIDKTLRKIEPVLYGSGRLSRVLDRPEKETKMFIFYLENGIFGDKIFYVTVSRTTSLKTIVQKLFAHHLHADNCEFRTDEDAKNQLENMMRQLGSHKILLVLDDVWSESESLIQDLHSQILGYTILVTSRFMFSRIGSTYELSLLNDEDARTLFCHSAFPNDGNQISVPDDLVSKMVKCCKGFPLALTVIGASLRGQDVVKWTTTLQKWSEGQSIFDSNSQLLHSLQASVDALEDLPIARDCFLDLGSFPEDEKISASALMDMWVEFYNFDKEGMYTSEYLQVLSSRNLLSLFPTRKDASELEGYCNEHYVTQHDLLRELAIHLSSKEPIALRERLYIEIHENDIPDWWIQQTQSSIDARLLLVFLDISDCLSINSLPDQFGELTGLKVLKMSNCHGLEELPVSVTNLTLLEDVTCDEATSYLWSYYEDDLCSLKINVVEEDRFANFMKIVG